jgi:hypothetical protein
MKSYIIIATISFWLICATSVRADRDIVYGARYYSPPGSRITTHYHIYRIRPDGTGKMQVTFGPNDDTGPIWSADGRQIIFTRSHQYVCEIPSGGGDVRYLARYSNQPGSLLDTADMAAIPHRHCIFIPSGDENGGESPSLMVDTRSGKRTPVWRSAGAVAFDPSGRYAALRAWPDCWRTAWHSRRPATNTSPCPLRT